MTSKQELLNQIKEVEEEFQTKINKIQKEIEELDKPTNPMAQIDGTYYILNSINEVVGKTDDGTKFALLNANTYLRANCYFNNKEVAQKESDFRNARRMLLKWKYEHDNIELDWKNATSKHFLQYNHIDHKLNIVYNISSEGSEIYFSKRSVLKKFIKEHGEEYCKLMGYTK